MCKWEGRNPCGRCPKSHLSLDNAHSSTTIFCIFWDSSPWDPCELAHSGWDSDWLFVLNWAWYLDKSRKTWFGVKEIASGPNGGPIKIPIVIILIGFHPSSLGEILDHHFFVEVWFPLQLPGVHVFESIIQLITNRKIPKPIISYCLLNLRLMGLIIADHSILIS